MSIFNEIQESGLNQILTRRLDIKGDVPSPAVVPEIGPVLTLENDRPEWGWLKGERLAGRLCIVNAVAAQFGAVQLALPPAAREIAVVERITWQNNTQLSVAQATILDGGLVGWVGITPAVRDFRWPAGSTALQLSSTTNALQPLVHAAIFQTNVANATFDSPIVITPGRALMIFCTTVNQPISVNVQWRERVGQLSELG